MWNKVILPLTLIGAVLISAQNDGMKQWHRDEFPNPRTDIQQCGRSRVSYVCDPDGLLSGSDADQLDQVIGEITRTTKCPCSADQCSRDGNGYKIGIAMVRSIKPGPVDSKQNVARNSLDESMKFAYTLLVDWDLDQCEDDIIIFYSQKDQVVYTMTGKTVQKKLPSDMTAEITMENLKEFQTGRYFTGLKNILNNYRLALNDQYKRKTYTPEGPKYLAVIGNSSPLTLPGLLMTLITALAVLLLH